MALTISAHAYGRAAEEALIAAVERGKIVGGKLDLLAPLTIVAPTALAGYYIRRELGRRAGGLVNVSVKPLSAVLELVGSAALTRSGRRPLPDAYQTEVIRTVAESAERVFGDIPIEGALLHTLEQRFDEFDVCSRDQLEAIRAQPGVPAYLVNLYDRYVEATRDFYTMRDLAVSATEALAGRPVVLRDIGALIVYLPSELPVAQRRFLDELSRYTEVEVVLGLTGDDEAVDAHTLHLWGVQAEGVELPDVPTAQRIVQAPDAEEEVRGAVREIAHSLLSDNPTALHRTAILYRQSDPYARICGEQLDAAGLTWNGAQATTLRQSIAGRTLDGLIALMTATPQLDAERKEVDWTTEIAPWLSAAPILDARGELAPSARWNQLARRANIRRGPDGWPQQLERYRTTVQADRDRVARSADEHRPGRLPWIDSELREIDSLQVFTAELVQFAQGAPSNARWSDYAQLARGALDRLLGGRNALAKHTVSATGDPSGDGDIELARWDDVQRLLTDLGALDELEEATPLRFAAAVRRALERQTGHRGRIGDGVFVGPLARAAGMRWDRVFVVGSAERWLPQIRQEDPLLSDRLRDLASMSSAADAQRRERAQYLAAMHAAEQRVLSYPRTDTRSQRATLPGRWLLESATALNGGERVFASRIDQAPASVIETVSSFEYALLSAHMPADVQEFDLQNVHLGKRPLEHYLSQISPAFQRGATRQAEWQVSKLTRWDGVIGDDRSAFEQVGRRLLSRPHSAGALSDWATCPYRYFLGRVLGIEEQDELGDDLQISPLDKGSLIHDIVEAFFRETEVQPVPAQQWTDEDRSRLTVIAEEQLDAARARGMTGRELLWRRDRRRIFDDLDTLLTLDDEHRAARGVQQQASELAFGRLPDSAGEVEFTLRDGSTLPLRGIIDRVDRGERTMVIDYKTGGVFPQPRELDKDPVVRGRFLQLPVYAHAVRQIDGLAEDVALTSAYWYITQRGEFTFSEVTWDAENRRRFEGVINLIADNIRAGHFPANPGGPGRGTPGEHCEFCSFNAICPPDRREHWEQIKLEPRLAAYVALAEPDEDEA